MFLITKRSAVAQYLITDSMFVRTENSHSQMFFKIGVLKNFPIFARKHLRWIIFLINPPQVFSCEYCKMFKNTYFEKHLQMTAFEI